MNPHISSLRTSQWMIDQSRTAEAQARAARTAAITALRADGLSYRRIAALGGISASAAWIAVHGDAR
jgi:hypothetical protein